MLTKPEIEKLILEDLKKVLLNKTIYKYADFNTGIDKKLLQMVIDNEAFLLKGKIIDPAHNSEL